MTIMRHGFPPRDTLATKQLIRATKYPKTITQVTQTNTFNIVTNQQLLHKRGKGPILVPIPIQVKFEVKVTNSDVANHKTAMIAVHPSSKQTRLRNGFHWLAQRLKLISGRTMRRVTTELVTAIDLAASDVVFSESDLCTGFPSTQYCAIGFTKK